MIALHDDWVWDSWYAQDGEDLHVFYLKAPKSLGDSDKRHHNAQVGHSVSTDGVNWTELPDALLRREGEYFDSQGIWTGSVLKHNDITLVDFFIVFIFETRKHLALLRGLKKIGIRNTRSTAILRHNRLYES